MCFSTFFVYSDETTEPGKFLSLPVQRYGLIVIKKIVYKDLQEVCQLLKRIRFVDDMLGLLIEL